MTVMSGVPVFESTWFAAASVVLLEVALTLLAPALSHIARWTLRTVRRHPVNWALLIWSTAAALVVVYLLFSVLSFSGPPQPHAIIEPSPQDLVQQRLAQDEKSLDKGVLTYPALPILQTDRPVTLTVTVTVTVTDLGKHPIGFLGAGQYSEQTGIMVYPGNVPTGGIVGLSLSCSGDVYCQALSSTRQTIVGLGTSQSWSWNLTPLQGGRTSVTIRVDTYDGFSSTVLNEEIINVGLQVGEGPWWAVISDWWNAIVSFATTSAGLITTVGGAVTVMAGGAAWLKRRRGRKVKSQPEKDAPQDTAEQDSPPDVASETESS